MKEILLGRSDFSALIQKNAYFVDKSLLIKEFIDSGDAVTLLVRPRRWGKSLAMAMLVDFFNDYGDGITKKDLFKDLAIAQAKIKDTDETYLDKYQGKSPVIMLSFKDIEKKNSFAEIKQSLAAVISRCCQQLLEGNKYLADYLTGNKNSELVKDFYALLSKKSDGALLENALNSLSSLLYKATNKKVYIFIDEYDHPLNHAFNTPYFAELSDFMKTFFSAGLKDNECLEKGLMTGILRISQASMLSGLNNLRVYTVLDKKYAGYFGFTEEEVNELLRYYSLAKYSVGIKDWYNGYNIGNTVIYNPWSIMNSVQDALGNQGELFLKNYWAESGTNDLIRETLSGSVDEIKEQLQLLSQPGGELIDIDVDTKVRFDQLSQRPNAFWSLLLATGYLTATSAAIGQEEVEYCCNLAIPNREVRSIFNSCVKGWLEEQKIKYLDYWKYLVNGEVDKFIHALKNFLASTASAKDAKNNRIQLENFYHGFMLGLSFGIHSHIVKSNVESGYGIYDLLIKPKVKKPDSLGIILEFKIPRDHETLTDAAQKGLDQIIANQYVTELEQEGYQDILVVGIAFVRKNISCVWSRGKNSAELKENGQKS